MLKDGEPLHMAKRNQIEILQCGMMSRSASLLGLNWSLEGGAF